MKVIVKVYDRCKYDTESKKMAELEYDIEDFRIRHTGEGDAQFDRDVEANYSEDERDINNEYLELTLEDGDTATFRNDRVDMFRW